MDLVFPLHVLEVFVLAAASLQQMLDGTELDGYCFVGVEVVGFVDLAEASLSD